MMDDKVLCHKADNPKTTTYFSRLVWDAMGSKKNGWVESGAKGTTPQAKKSTGTDLGNEAKYRALMEQAKGFTQDGKHTDALNKLLAAQALKDSPHLKGLINKAGKAIEEETNAAMRGETLANADAAFTAGDFATAVELYTAAQVITATDDVAAKLTEATAKEEASLTE